MAHQQQLQFFKLVKNYLLNNLNESHTKIKIIEIGSFNVNGSIRDFMQTDNIEYLGVDLCEGKGVDLVSYGHEVSHPNDTYEVALSGECFEHDPKWQETFKNMYRMTKPGGVIAFTCATTGRLEHGTRRSGADQSPGTQFIGLDYYKNLNKNDFYKEFDFDKLFSQHNFYYESTSYDLYFYGVKIGSPIFSMNYMAFVKGVEQIKKLKKMTFKIIDVPVYIARLIFKEQKFQDFSCIYLEMIRPARIRFKSFFK